MLEYYVGVLHRYSHIYIFSHRSHKGFILPPVMWKGEVPSSEQALTQGTRSCVLSA